MTVPEPPLPPANVPDHTGLPELAPDHVEEELASEIDNSVPAYGYQMLPMVGLGGSAGSVRALQEFFNAMPAESGLVFVVVLHLAPGHESTMAEVLGRATTMPVVQATDRIEVRANCVYVIPPGKHLSAVDGILQLSEMDHERGRRVTLDLFFRSLADSHGPHSAAIVLSGADGDGALGIKRIKERGGLTIAQDPDEAEHSSMPQSAIATGMVDWVLRVAQMPQRLLEYQDTAQRLKLPPEEGPQPAEPPPTDASGKEVALREVLSFLRARTGRDFTYYKRATILRRIARRMQVNAVTELPAYLDFMRTHPGEAGALLQDLLISVTNFFRDRGAFEALEAGIPELFSGKKSGDTLRVWTAACATGEEAYSVAMLLCEYAGRLENPPAIQVFATDLDEESIASARDGVYPTTITADVTDERLRRFFVKEPHGYRVRRDLREMVLFAVHDLLRDSPFSRLDLITCRNLLIYLTREAQMRACEIFHFALRKGGRLFLGASETMDEESGLYTLLDKTHRIYTKCSDARVTVSLPTGSSALRRALEARDHASHGPFIHGAAFVAPGKAAQAKENANSDAHRVSWEELHFKLIERFAPPSLIVDRDYHIVHISENAGRFLHFSGGTPSVNLLQVVHPMLRVELRAALFRAVQTSSAVEVFRVPVDLDGTLHAVDLRVAPAQDIAPDYLLVVLSLRENPNEQTALSRVEDEPAIRHLEREIEQVKSRLRETVEQYETSTEELKASNEELQAMNEELRSATEELETGREELQSVNEELTTVNQELKSNIEELAHTNSDLQNLMSATAIATVFLDRELRIARYTPPAIALFNLIPGDVGRPLADLQHRLDYPELAADAVRVLETLTPIEREVSAPSGNCFLARLRPYRTTEDVIAGAVLTFVDITERQRSEEALRVSEERLRLVVENARDYAIFSMDQERRITGWNSGAQRLLGYTEAEILGQPADVIFTPEDRESGACAREAETALAVGRATDERWHLRKDGSRFWGSGVMMAMHDGTGQSVGLVEIFRDQTEARAASEALEESRAQLWEALQENERARADAEAATLAKDHFLAVLSHELRTPLTPVLMAVETMRRCKDLPESLRSGLEMIERNIQIEAHFIDDMLDLTRIAKGKLELIREPMDLHAAVRGAVEVSAADFEEKKQRLSIALDAGEYRLTGDICRLQQVFWNLLKNASKFTPGGGEITLRSRNERDCIVVEITDNGIGIEAGVIPKIFNPFEQADPSIAREFGGLGLGLAISKATILGHGGQLLAASPGPGKGATFTVELPLGDESPRPSVQPSPSS